MNRFLFGQEHVDRYRATDGEEGHEWLGTQVLLLTTKGRRSGESRTVALIYGTSGHDYLVVASKGGSHRPPAWYLNLEADPEVEVQVKAIASRPAPATPPRRRSPRCGRR